jgi:hypothetical protein
MPVSAAPFAGLMRSLPVSIRHAPGGGAARQPQEVTHTAEVITLRPTWLGVESPAGASARRDLQPPLWLCAMVQPHPHAGATYKINAREDGASRWR